MGSDAAEAEETSAETILMLLIASAAVMLLGLLVAFLFKGKRIDA